MGILRRLREWREDKDGTLIGPNIEADSVKTDQITVKDGLVAGETIDTASGTDQIQFTDVPSSDYEQLIIYLESYNPGGGSDTIELTINNNDSNGQYGYLPNNSAPVSNSDTLQLASTSGRVDFAGTVTLDVVSSGSGQAGFALSESVTLPFRNLSNLDTISIGGGTIITPSNSDSIEVFADEGDNNAMAGALLGVR